MKYSLVEKHNLIRILVQVNLDTTNQGGQKISLYCSRCARVTRCGRGMGGVMQVVCWLDSIVSKVGCGFRLWALIRRHMSILTLQALVG